MRKEPLLLRKRKLRLLVCHYDIFASRTDLPHGQGTLASLERLSARFSARPVRHITEQTNQKYSFFDYAKSEALHLSQRETEQIVCCLRNLENELRYPADVHSSVILSYHIELMLEYCTRYYERQFITRDNQNKAIVCKTERWIDRYTEGCHPDKIQVPPPTTCAATLKLSAAYFNDLLKFETGKTGMNISNYICTKKSRQTPSITL